MRKVIVYSLLLIVGLFGSQLLPNIFTHYNQLQTLIMISTMTALSYIMINVGREFEIDKNNLKQYRWDYIVAMTTATFPWIAAIFMVLVGLSLPPLFNAVSETVATTSLSMAMPAMGMKEIIYHVLVISVLANLGKMFPLFCYRKEATLRERLALSISMWPRGEVGAGVLMISLGYGFGGPMITISMLSLALNLVMTGLFIMVVRYLIVTPTSQSEEERYEESRAKTVSCGDQYLFIESIGRSSRLVVIICHDCKSKTAPINGRCFYRVKR